MFIKVWLRIWKIPVLLELIAGFCYLNTAIGIRQTNNCLNLVKVRFHHFIRYCAKFCNQNISQKNPITTLVNLIIYWEKCVPNLNGILINLFGIQFGIHFSQYKVWTTLKHIRRTMGLWFVCLRVLCFPFKN